MYIDGVAIDKYKVNDGLYFPDVEKDIQIKLVFRSNSLLSSWTRNEISVYDVDGNAHTIIPGGRKSGYEVVNLSLERNYRGGKCYIDISGTSSLGPSGSASAVYCPKIVEVPGTCSQVYDPIKNWNNRCFRNNNDSGCSNSRYCHNAGRNSVCWTCVGNGNSYGKAFVYTPNYGSTRFRPYDRGSYKGNILWSKRFNGSWRYWDDDANRKAKELCEHPYECSTDGKRYISENTCKQQCGSYYEEQSVYKCSLDGTSYDTVNLCESNCKDEETYLCNSGVKVENSSECESWFCPLDEVYYGNEGSCVDACTNNISCNAQSESYEFEVAIQNDGGNDYIQQLRQNAPVDRNLNATAYLHEDLILRQCVDRYKSPSLSFDDPQNYHFEFGPIDHLTFNYAAEVAHELPFKSHEGTLILPDQPPVYTGGSESVPRRPMFPDLDLSLSWADDDAVRLGRYSLGVGNIKPLAYYYECPQGRIEPGYGCNADPDPFGGTDWTVKGDYCFQHRCSEGQLDDPEHTYSGCGYVNDGSWE